MLFQLAQRKSLLGVAPTPSFFVVAFVCGFFFSPKFFCSLTLQDNCRKFNDTPKYCTREEKKESLLRAKSWREYKETNLFI